MNRFSTALRLVCFIDDRAVDAIVSVFILMAEDWDSAFEKALEIGRGQERSYSNSTDELVLWRLAEIVTIDELSGELDGREVYSDRVEPREGDVLDSLDPSSSRPTQSGV
jgi:hypothetical protein